jgi:hypothetical protein
MMPADPARQTHDYIRNGTSSLFAALDVATGTVITRMHRRHRAAEFKKFLNQIDREVPADLVSAAVQRVRDGVIRGGHGWGVESPARRLPGGAWWPNCRGGAQSVAVASLIAMRAEDSSTMVLLVL